MKKRWKNVRRLLCLAIILSLVLPFAGPATVLPASAVTQAEIDALKDDANDLANQKKELQEQLNEVKADKNEALKQKQLLEEQIEVIRAEISNINSQISTYEDLISQKTQELEQSEAQEQEQYELFCSRVRAMEEEGETSYWAILFGSSDFSELLDNYMMVEEIIEYDNSVMEALAQLQQQVEQERAELEEAKTALEEAKAKQQAAKAELETQEAEVDKVIAEISSQESQLKQMESELNQAAAALDSQIKDLERQMSAQISNVQSESGFMWPLASNINVLSSLYGSRPDPFTGRPDNHTGIDIPAARGTPIYASKSGVVITSVYGSGSSWSYGNYVVVAHSDGTSTLYAHMSSRAVSKGQTVKQGDVVGYVGTTGNSTGNHLHFEIRVNGSRVDPLNYFKDLTLYYRSGGQKVKLDL